MHRLSEILIYAKKTDRIGRESKQSVTIRDVRCMLGIAYHEQELVKCVVH